MTVDKAYTLTMGGKIWALDCPKIEHVGDAIIQPNVYNKWDLVDGTLTITKGEEKPNVVNMYIIRFNTKDVNVVFNGWELSWVGGVAPVFTKGYTYEITIIDNFANCLQS